MGPKNQVTTSYLARRSTGRSARVDPLTDVDEVVAQIDKRLDRIAVDEVASTQQLLPSVRQSLSKVGRQIVGMFDAHGNTHCFFGDSCSSPRSLAH